jgi:predicted transcriptional regulator
MFYKKEALREAIEENFEEILDMTKAVANESRFRILIVLLSQNQTFKDLIEATTLQKTALSNHLNQLLETGLIEKPEYGLYAITKDGSDLIASLERGYSFSFKSKIKRFEKDAKKKMSEDFVASFFKTG